MKVIRCMTKLIPGLKGRGSEAAFVRDLRSTVGSSSGVRGVWCRVLKSQ